VTRPKLRHDNLCWAGCGAFAAKVDLSALTDRERETIIARPRACWRHAEIVEAELAVQLERYRERVAA
jgi:hypothetical protein